MSTRHPALERLEPLVGEWSMEALFPDAPPSDLRGRAVFEWVLDGQFLLQRAEIPHPAAPDGLMIIRFDPASGSFSQIYFDSRGVARIYAMSLDDGVWRLSREAPDFSPLDFSQRFTGTFSHDGNTIDGAWETSTDGSTWEHDFGLVYTRLG